MIEVPSISITRPFEGSILTKFSVFWEKSEEVLSCCVASPSTVPRSLRETAGAVPDSTDLKGFDTLW